MRKPAIIYHWWLSSGASSELSIGDIITLQNLTGENQYLLQDRVPNSSFEPPLFWDGEKTIHSLARPWNPNYNGQATLHYYHPDNGAYPASIEVGKKQGSSDRHLVTTHVALDDKIHVVQEVNHIGDINRFEVDKDFSKSTLAQTLSGLYSRTQCRKTGANTFALLMQQDSKNFFLSLFNGTTLSAPVEVLTSSTRRVYPGMPVGQYTHNGKHCINLTVLRADETLYPCRLALFTDDYVTFYNKSETDSFVINTGRDITTLTGDWITVGTLSQTTVNYSVGASCIDSSGNYYEVNWLTNTANTIQTTYWNGSTWAHNTFNLPLNIAGASPAGLADPSGYVFSFFRNGALYMGARVESTFKKFFLYKSTDLGVTWEFVQDLNTGINKHIHKCGVPYNINEIPNNKNFPVYSCEWLFDDVASRYPEVYITEASFGTIKETGPEIYIPTVSEINDIAGFEFIYEADDLNVTGATIDQINDKTGNGFHAVKRGSPQLTAGEIVTNGTNNGFDIPIGAIPTTDNNFTHVFVGRSSGANGYYFQLSQTAVAGRFAALSIPNTGGEYRSRYQWAFSTPTEALRTYIPSTPFGVGENNIIIVTGDGLGIRVYINGREQNKRHILGDFAYNAKWANSLTPTAAGIGYVRQTSFSFSPVTFLANAYMGSVISTENRKKIENFLSTKYSITLQR